MEVGEIYKKYKGYHSTSKPIEETMTEYRYRIIKIYPKEFKEKDLILCEEVNLGYKERFHRMDLEGIKNDS